jgi:hypothetical protein
MLVAQELWLKRRNEKRWGGVVVADQQSLQVRLAQKKQLMAHQH